MSRIAPRTIAPRPTRAPGITTESDTSASLSMRTSGLMTDRRTIAPEMIDPAPTTESCAIPPSTNFAGASGQAAVRIGHPWLYRLKTGSTEIRSRCAS